MKRWFGAGLALVTLAGCATEGPPPPPGMGPPGRMGMGPHRGPPGMGGEDPGPVLFISPCGRPYRAVAGGPDPVGVWFAGADTNHDGKLDRAEFRADADLFFRVLDRDHDGVVAGSEITFYEQRIAPEILLGPDELSANPNLLIRVQMQGGGMPGGGGGMPGGGGGMPGGGGGPPDGPGGPPPGGMPRAPRANMTGAAAYNFLHEPEPVTASDGNFDHLITAEEFAAAADRRFKLLDKDGDGFLTLDTLPPIGGPGGRPGRGPPPGMRG